MDKETLSNYGWIVIVVIVLAIMIALATPFGSYVVNGVDSIAKSFSANANVDADSAEAESGNFEMLDGDNTVINTSAFAPLSFRSSAPYEDFKEVRIDGEVVDSSNYTVRSGSTIVTFNTEYTQALSSGSHKVEIVSEGGSAEGDFNVNTSNVIPEGGTYYVGVTTYVAGDYSGATATYKAGDEFPSSINTGDIFVYGDYEYRYNKYIQQGSWSTYSSMNGWGVRVLDKTKTKYGEILDAINGANINNLSGTYRGCANLTDIDNLVFPNNVYSFSDTFFDCTSLTDVSGLVFPENVTGMNSTFFRCTNLKSVNGLVIPENVIYLSETFYGCTSLTDVSGLVIPANVSYMRRTFERCAKLRGTITIHANPTNYDYCLSGTNISNILGDTTLKSKILETKTTSDGWSDYYK